MAAYPFGPDVIKMVLIRRPQEESEEKEIPPQKRGLECYDHW